MSDSSWVNPCTTSGGGPTSGVPLDGGWSTALVTDPEIQNVSRTAVLLYEQSIDSVVALRLLEVLQAQKQVEP